MIEYFEKGTNNKTLILFHGTGGNEKDLIPLAKAIDSNANLLSFRGRVNENGMYRFFKRIAPGVFDLDSLKEETYYYLHRIQELAKVHQFKLDEAILIGYSNGANIIGSMVFHQKDIINKAVLIRPMVPLKEAPHDDLLKTNILMLSGMYDSIVPKQEANELKQMFEKRNANVVFHLLNTGHQIIASEISLIKNWLENI